MSDPYQRAASAYSKPTLQPSDPRRLEGEALLQAAARLEHVHRNWRPEIYAQLDAALLFNRKLWTIFATEATSDASPLPLELRNNIASLSVFVFKRSLELLAQPAAAPITPLIDIDRNIAAGLLARSGATVTSERIIPGNGATA